MTEGCKHNEIIVQFNDWGLRSPALGALCRVCGNYFRSYYQRHDVGNKMGDLYKTITGGKSEDEIMKILKETINILQIEGESELDCCKRYLEDKDAFLEALQALEYYSMPVSFFSAETKKKQQEGSHLAWDTRKKMTFWDMGVYGFFGENG